MKGNKKFWLLGILAPVLIAAGGIIYVITGEMGSTPIVLMWIGLLFLLLFFYTNFTTIGQFISKRSTKYGANVALMIVVVFAIVGLIGVMSVNYKLRIDLTENKRYSLSQQTIKILKSLKRDVEAIAFYRSDGRTRQAMYDLLKEYSYYSTKFNFWFIDPDKKPADAAKYGVTSYRTTLIRSGKNREVVGFESESKLTNALMKVIRDKVKTLYFVKGHGENDIEDTREYGYKVAKEAMEKESYQVRDLLLARVDDIPEDASVLVVSGPKKDLLKSELDKITDFVNKGGSVLFMLDPAPLTELALYLKGYNFELKSDIIVDKLVRIVGTNYLTLVVTEYSSRHPITRDLTNIFSFFPIARSVSITEDPSKGNYNLAKTSASSWGRSKGKLEDDNIEFDPAKDQRGPLNIMAVSVVEVKSEHEGNSKMKVGGEGHVQRWGKIVVVGDSNFAGNTHIKLAGNRDLFLNTINWLAEDHALISVRKKEPGISPMTLTDSQGRLVFWLSVLIVPSLVMIVGIGVITRRRSEV